MKGQKSTYTFYSYGCCMDCYIWFLDERPHKIDAWKAGWRPGEEDMKQFREMMKD